MSTGLAVGCGGEADESEGGGGEEEDFGVCEQMAGEVGLRWELVCWEGGEVQGAEEGV